MTQIKTEVAAKAYARYLRISPRKVRYVLDLVRGESVPRALVILSAVNKNAVKPIYKALKSALSNAKNNPTVREEELFISKIMADGGPMFKRYRAAAMGRATMIRHRTTHIFIELSRIIKKTDKPQVKKASKTKTRK